MLTYKVFDDFLSPQDHQLVWHYIQNERLEFVHQSRWVKAFRLTDGNPLWGPPLLSDAYEKDQNRGVYPSGKGIDLVVGALKKILPACREVVGEQGKDWAYFFSRAYVYPKNTGLSWHRDNQNAATGAFVYYAHPEWNPQWGGEFLLASAKTKDFVFPEKELYGEEAKFLGSHLDNTVEQEVLLEDEPGTYLFPKPNRLVVITSGVLHCIKKVEEAAGNNVRATIQGFFQDPAGLLTR